jgi:hypothetical protein
MAYGRIRDTKRRYYIAYGSNLNIQQMRMRCPSARVIGVSALEGYRLMFKGSKTGAYLTIEPHDGGIVPVAVWEVTEDDERALDHYEGFPRFYYKEEMKLPVKGIRSGKVRERMVFVYIMQEDRPYGLPSDHYVNVCRQGYDAFGFDNRRLTEALQAKIKEILTATDFPCCDETKCPSFCPFFDLCGRKKSDF